MIVDEEFKSLIPPLSQEEYKGLEESILSEGVRESLIVWDAPDGNRYLVDGHNRYEIAQKHNLQFNVRRMEFEDRNAVIRWMILNQFGRRNLSAYDRSILALKLKPVMVEEAHQRMSDGAKGVQISAQPKTRDKLADVAGVSHDTIHKVEVIEKKAPEELKKAVKTGEVSINSAYNQVRAEDIEIKNPIKEMTKKAKKEHEEFQEEKTSDVVDFTKIQNDKQNQEILGNEFYKQLCKISAAVDSIMLLKEDGELKESVNMLDWYALGDIENQLSRATRGITAIRALIEERRTNGKGQS